MMRRCRAKRATRPLSLLVLLALVFGSAGLSQAMGTGPVIETVAGNGLGDGGPATAARLNDPRGVAVDGAGNLYIADTPNHCVRRVDAQSGIITTVAGSAGSYGDSGDGGPATEARFYYPIAVALDGAGNLYIADPYVGRVRRVDAQSGIITAVAAQLNSPFGVAVDGAGNVYIAEADSHIIRRVDAQSGIITTVAGTGIDGYSGDGGPATAAQLWEPNGVVLDGAGNLYIADTYNNRIRRVDAQSGIITTVAGTGIDGYSGDGGPATDARLSDPRGVALDPFGNLYIADAYANRIRQVSAQSGIITTAAGNGTAGYSGDGGPAKAAQLNNPHDIALDDLGNLYIADSGNNRIRRLDADSVIITTMAGSSGDSGDGGLATAAQLQQPTDAAADSVGHLYIADTANHRIRRVDAVSGTITTVAGTGIDGYAGDGGPATAARLHLPTGVAVDSAGNLFVVDRFNHRVRRVDAQSGVITTVAGTGSLGYAGDGGPATAAHLAGPRGMALDGTGTLFIADAYNHRIRRVDAQSGVITTVAGTGSAGYAGDRGSATAAKLNEPHGVAVDGSGHLYIADTDSNRIRRVDAQTGIISTVAGTGRAGYAGDGGPATLAQLYYPRAVALDSAGNLLIADTENHCIRRVDAQSGIISTVAGTGSYGYSGDDGPAAEAQVHYPHGIAVDPEGNLLIADTHNHRIRRVREPVSGVFQVYLPLVVR